MDQQTRNRLQNATQNARLLLETEFAAQLEGTYDILPSGTIHDEGGTHLNSHQCLIRQKLVDTIKHYIAGGKESAEAVADYTREAAFTFLNRFVALKMLEARGLLHQCISKGEQSSGFKEFTGLAPGLADFADHGYRLYLECLFDELSTEVRILFDRRDVASLLWPRRQALNELLDTLNSRDLLDIWGEDETIGWVYQYFNSQEERRQMREESQAPRNNRELAVRNQFFTPRYVVEFLTDNTLGRIWYEMRQGDTVLNEKCQYLVRRPKEIFLKEGENAPDQKQDENLSQEELLKQPVYVPYRSKKDPRDLKILDPACGSGHFLLYCFDLLLEIYEEAWADEQSLASELTGKTLREDFDNIEELHKALPGLILRYNLHGIDIDPRCTQIAAFCLWMRAQKAFNDFGHLWAERPSITKTNIVVAEPMPGEKDMLREFASTLQPKLLGQLVEVVFDKMKLAGETGPLLKIEEEIKSTVNNALKEWKKVPRQEQLLLFEGGRKKIEQLQFDFSGITDEDFWHEAENRIYTELDEYSHQTSNGKSFRRKLFADDADRGFAFIDLCRNLYDIVLMNPPFGDMPRTVYAYSEEKYPRTKFDFHTTFMERALQLTNINGFAAYISNRTWFSLYRLDQFRRDIVFENQLELVADLGIGVLDGALVEAACTIIRHGENNLEHPIVFRLITVRDKQNSLLKLIAQQDSGNGEVFLPSVSTLKEMPRSIFGYWFPEHLATLLSKLPNFYPGTGFTRQGLASRDDFRFLRLRWEVPPSELGRKWSAFAKGGEYEPFFDDIHLVIDFSDNGKELKSFIVEVKGEVSWSRNIPSSEMYGSAGLTYPERTTSDFSPRPMPTGCIFSATGQAVFLNNHKLMRCYIGFAYSRIFKQLIELFIGAGDATESGSAARHYTSGIFNEIPFPQLKQSDLDELYELAVICINSRMKEYAFHEDSFLFTIPITCRGKYQNLHEIIENAQSISNRNSLEIGHIFSKVDLLVAKLYGLDEKDYKFLEDEVCPNPFLYPVQQSGTLPENIGIYSNDLSRLITDVCESRGYRRAYTKKSYWTDRQLELLAHLYRMNPDHLIEQGVNVQMKHLENPVRDMISYCLGIVVGRWDIRYAIHGLDIPDVPDPFEELPACSPGMLVGPNNMPAKMKSWEQVPLEKNPSGQVAPDIVSREWLTMRKVGNAILEMELDKSVAHLCGEEYPVQVAWDGILVDDPGHQFDVTKWVKEVLGVIWQDSGDDIYREAIEMLDGHADDLRPWFRKHFFAEHIKQYSKSRRKAPIYWCLATPSNGYAIWLYYHRFTKDTFYKALNDYVKPKVSHEETKLQRVRQEFGPNTTSGQRRDIDNQENFVSELKSFQEDIERIAPLWNPNLNDGVIINFAPLWRLVPQMKSWQKECKKCWDKLVNGDYDWAHLAMHLWPERVVPKCQQDVSLAIAHGLDDVFWKQDKDGKWKQKEVSKEQIEELITDRTSSAVKAALESLLSAPAVGNGLTRRRRSARSRI